MNWQFACRLAKESNNFKLSWILIILHCSLASGLTDTYNYKLWLFVPQCCTLWCRQIQAAALRPIHLSYFPSTGNAEGSPGDNLQALWHYKLPQGHLRIFVSHHIFIFSLWSWMHTKLLYPFKILWESLIICWQNFYWVAINSDVEDLIAQGYLHLIARAKLKPECVM